jgi:HlyD family secretion protein
MQVETKIDEADIGRVAPGLSATFTVDAFPEDTFGGTVRQVRLEPLTEQNVVTYTTVIDVSNPELKLKPGMTANVTIRIEKRDDVLRVPNAALRFRPPEAEGRAGASSGDRASSARAAMPADAAGESRATMAAGEGRTSGARRRRGGGGSDSSVVAGGAPEGHKRQVVYTVGPDGKLAPTRVATGITDGTYTEVRSRELTEGALVVTGAQPKKGQTAATTTAGPGMGGPGGQRGGGMRRF